MKTRRTIIMILTLCVALSFTACTGKGDVGKADSSSVSEGTEKTEDLQAKLDDLYQQENEIFEKHKDVWEKVFSKMSKADAGSDNYAEYLASTVESNKNSFTDDELKTLKEENKKVINFTVKHVEEQPKKKGNYKEGEEQRVYPFKTEEDLQKMHNYFVEKKMWRNDPLFVVGVNVGQLNIIFQGNSVAYFVHNRLLHLKILGFTYSLVKKSYHFSGPLSIATSAEPVQFLSYFVGCRQRQKAFSVEALIPLPHVPFPRLVSETGVPQEYGCCSPKYPTRGDHYMR